MNLPRVFTVAAVVVYFAGGRVAAGAESGHVRPPADAVYRQANAPIEKRVEDLLGRMTLEEKLGQLHQSSISLGSKSDFHLHNFAPEIRSGRVGSYIWAIEAPVLRNRLQRVAVEQSRLGIPLMFGLDVIHGDRTIFPISLGLSCAWEPSLFEKLEAVAASEARHSGVDWVFAPMCNLARDPRWGRVAETCGEDPYLASQCIAAAVRGFQGIDPSSPDRVAACLKHFVGYSGTIGGRDYNATEVPNFTMRNFFLPVFHSGVRAGALSVMSSFNANDGIPATDNGRWLTGVLRDQWGFQGVVVSDWDSVHESITWGYAANETDAAEKALTAGTDVEMVSRCYEKLAAEVRAGRFPIDRINRAVKRVLRMKFELGLFDQPYVKADDYSKAILRPEARTLAREAVARSCVLLKNHDVLPLGKDVRKVALIGPFADDAREMLGCWQGMGRPGDVITLASALRKQLGDHQVGLTVIHGCDVLENTPPTKTLTDGTVVRDKSVRGWSATKYDPAKAVAAARSADAVIMALGEPAQWTGENASRATLGLTGHQQELFDAVAATGKPVIVVLFCGRPLAISDLATKAAAILVAWQPGVEAGPGIADLLTGRVSPSGHLTESWPRSVGQVPIYYNHYITGRPDPGSGHYRDLPHGPLFPFGYGLTYTTFHYGPVSITPAGKGSRAFIAKVRITNTGGKTGVAVPELYIHQVACAEGARPVQELRGFRRVTLKPGETREVTFRLDGHVIGYWGRDGSWREDPGSYRVWIASRSGEGTPVSFDFPALNK